MSSEVDIANLALGHLGDRATVASLDPPEGSAQAEHCAQFYPIARDAVLEMHAWRFATKRAVLADLSLTDEPPTSWGFSYAAPADCLKVLQVYASENTRDDQGETFETESGEDGTDLIFTNVEDAKIRYVARVTDTAKFSPLFVTTVSWYLASLLAGPVIKGSDGMTIGEKCLQKMLLFMARAQVSDANQRKSDNRADTNNQASWIKGR